MIQGGIYACTKSLNANVGIKRRDLRTSELPKNLNTTFVFKLILLKGTTSSVYVV